MTATGTFRLISLLPLVTAFHTFHIDLNHRPSCTSVFSQTSEVGSSQCIPWTDNPKQTSDFSKKDDWGWVFTTVPEEAVGTYELDDIEGNVPGDLKGTYYKNSHGNFERGGERFAHILDGDGFVVAITFSDKVTYRARFVETEYFLREKQEDKILYRNVFGTQRRGGALANCFDLVLKNVANTNVLKWGGRLFAFWEAGRPHELDPITLETLEDKGDGPTKDLGRPDCMRGMSVDSGGPVDRMLNFGRSFTAHPHISDDGTTLVAFRQGSDPLTSGLNLEFVEYDQDWNLKQVTPYTVQGPAMAPHDFSSCTDYFCFFENQMTISTLSYILGLEGPAAQLRQRLDVPSKLHLVPRGRGKALELEVPTFFCIHMSSKAVLSNDNKHLTLYSNGWDLKDTRFFPSDQDDVPFLGSWGGDYPDYETYAPTRLWRTVVDLNTGSISQHAPVLARGTFEFPSIDNQEPRYIYGQTGVDGCPPVGWCRVDTETDEVQYWWAEPKTFCEELIAVPKKNGKRGSWLMGFMHDAKERRTTLAILDSEEFERGPVCRIHLKHRIAWGIHGSFAET